MIFRKYILFLVSFCAVQFVLAQDGATIKAVLDKNKILIGEPLQLKVEAYLPAGSATSFPAIDSIEHFEFVAEAVIDSASKKDGRTFTGVYMITSFDSGHWVIPSFILSKEAKTDTIPVDVVFSEFDPNQAYHDIKDILEVAHPKKGTPWWWYAAAGAILIALLVFYLVRKKKTTPPVISKPLLSAYEEAMQGLEQLVKNKPDVKTYHSKLTDIFRLYIFRKKGIQSLQKTTDDLVVQLKNLELPKEQFDTLSQSLRLSDFVKFAKYIPGNEDDGNCFNEIKKAIMVIDKTEAKTPL
ncbi:MAG: LPXTG cell wall anchor domain-containing protein [Bacteroidota bacterium]|nr:LPXTG cell wall anchor domain-containing protein [Bacteroidota bacterium]